MFEAHLFDLSATRTNVVNPPEQFSSHGAVGLSSTANCGAIPSAVETTQTGD